jgi:hypothetical protein
MTTLSLFNNPEHDLTLDETLTTSAAILGMSGSGKSNTTARYAEQLHVNLIPFVIADIAGEYWGLKEKCALVIAGKSPHVDIELTDTSQAAALAAWSLDQRVSVVLDVSLYRPKARKIEMVAAYLEALYEKALTLRRPYKVILEEAHNYIPQSETTVASDIVVTLAAEGRKSGLGLVMVSQRPARIDKDALSQAGIRILHSVFDARDVKAYQEIAPDVSKATMLGLQPGEAILVYPQKRIVQVVGVKLRETYHAGYTPGMEAVEQPAFAGVDENKLAALREALAVSPIGEKPDTRIAGMQTTIDDQRQQIEALQAQVERLTQENTLLAKFKIEMKSPELMAVGTVNAAQLVLPAHPFPASVQDAPHGHDAGQPLPALPAQPIPAPEEPYRSALATTRAINRQQTNFDSLLRDIKAQSHMHRRMLAYLVRRNASEFAVNELARYLGVQVRTLTANPPTWMVNKGLLKRKKFNRIYWYHAKDAYNLLAAQFPDLDTDAIWEKLVKSVDENKG